MTIEQNEIATRIVPLQPEYERLEDLYARTQGRLVIQVAALVGDISAAEDLVQDAFRRCVEKWDRVALYDDPESWVRSVAFNLARSRWRRFATMARAVARLRQPEAAEPDRADVALMTAVSRLPDDEREVVVRHYLLDLPVLVVASQLDVPEGTVKSRLARARARLADTLGGGKEDDDKHD
ncbi:MAG: sigma-70 family RNA polymerase sigma factor [Acidimicrobiales bacterium]